MSIVTQGIRDFVKKAIADNNVMIFSKSYCPYCMRAKDLFDDIDVDYKALELNEHKDGAAIQKALADLTNQTTVPNIFVGQKHVGGADALNSMFTSGKLKKLIEEAGISNAKF